MSLSREIGVFFLSVFIAVGVTTTFLMGGSIFVDDVDVRIDPTDGSPVPVSGFEQTGSPPTAIESFPQFEEVSESAGFIYEPRVPTGIEVVDSGVYVADVNNDGYEDILAVGEQYPVLFENVGGEYVPARTFEVERVQTAHFFDFYNNGYEDLLLAQYGGEFIFYENVGGHFVERDIELDTQLLNPSSIVSADFTGNDCLDVFVTQNGLWSGTTPLTHAAAQRVEADHPDERPVTESGNPNLLLHGDCKSLTDITGQSGIDGNQWTLTSSAADFTGSGWPDIHVGNDWSEDYLYINRGDGTFEKQGLGPDSDRNAMSSNPVDMTGNLAPDIFVTNIYYPENSNRTSRAPPLNRDAALPYGNNFFVNDGTGNFTDKALEYGLERGGWGWTATVADFTNDGHLDIIQTTTDVYWVEPYSSEFGSLQVWQGNAEGWEKLSSAEYGLRQSNTYSAARVDYNNNGNLDVVIGTAPLGPTLRESAQPFKLYENQRNTTDEYLQFFVRDPDVLDRNAAVYIETDKRIIHKSPNSQGNFQTQDSRLVHVGLENEEVERVIIKWPDGVTTEYTTLEAGNRYILSQDDIEVVR